MKESHLYPEFVKSRVKPGITILKETGDLQAHLTHMALGIAGEAGELVDALKKHTIYGKKLDLTNVIEELGDLEFYMEGLRQALSIEREETIEANIVKLSLRYNKGKYSDEDAITRRDKEGGE